MLTNAIIIYFTIALTCMVGGALFCLVTDVALDMIAAGMEVYHTLRWRWRPAAITAAAAVVALASCSSAAAAQQELYQHANPSPTVLRTMEKLTGQDAARVLPLNRPHANELALPYQPAVGPAKHVIDEDWGGSIFKYNGLYKTAAQRGDTFDITGPCESACTLVLTIPRERLCFGRLSYLGFHMARENGPNGTPSLQWSEWMIIQYPADVQGWIEAKGGASKLPVNGMWKMPAFELWKMGYRKCE